MSVKRPSRDQIRAASQRLGLSLDDTDIAEFANMIGDTVDEYYLPLDEIPDYLPEVKYPRTPGHKPGPEENPLGAWYVKSTISGAKRGKLSGKKIVIKDNICVAGLPMMNGSSTFEGYVPDVDATVVTRILDAGGTILGKAHCEYFCFSGGSHTNAAARTLNPYNRAHCTGGSSSGCAALVASGEVDMAIGGDQGGSIREPSAFCGIYGMKPTYGLVPYTGAFPIEMTLDHLGPMSASTQDNALLLEAIAGLDGLDPRQSTPKPARYTRAIGDGVKGMQIGIVQEGFEHDASESDVDDAVQTSAEIFQSLGAKVENVSIPMHKLGMAIWVGIAVEGSHAQMLKGNALGNNWRGLYVTSMLEAHASWPEKANSFSEILKLGALCAEYIHSEYQGRYYAKSQNLNRKLHKAYDEALSRYDLLLMPTVPIKAPKLPPRIPTRVEDMSPGFIPIINTAPFDCTGHPAMNVPCAMRDGLPVGMMLIGKYYDEFTIYRAADAFEHAVDWKER